MNERSNILIGFDLNHDYSQISYYNRKDAKPVTVSCVAGTPKYQFPTLLCKKYGADSWHYGLEAEHFAVVGDGEPVENLLEICQKSQKAEIDGEEYEAWELMGIFLEKALSMVNPSGRDDAISGIMFTAEEVSQELLENLKKAVSRVSKKGFEVFLQGHKESFYHYMLNQKKDLWNYEVGLFEHKEDRIICSHLHLNRQLVPIVATLDEKAVVQIHDGMTEEEKDKALLEAAQKMIGEQAFSSLYLIGNGFDKEWMDESLIYLCNRRKVFQGENLYTKGACYAVRDRLEIEVLKDYLFESPHMVRMNVGMNVVRRGEKMYYPLVQAGINWFEAKGECEFLLDGSDEILLLLNAIDRQEPRSFVFRIPDLPKRPPKTTRIRVEVVFIARDTCKVKASDLGFGEFFPSSGRYVEEIIEL